MGPTLCGRRGEGCRKERAPSATFARTPVSRPRASEQRRREAAAPGFSGPWSFRFRLRRRGPTRAARSAFPSAWRTPCLDLADGGQPRPAVAPAMRWQTPGAAMDVPAGSTGRRPERSWDRHAAERLPLRKRSGGHQMPESGRDLPSSRCRRAPRPSPARLLTPGSSALNRSEKASWLIVTHVRSSSADVNQRGPRRTSRSVTVPDETTHRSGNAADCRIRPADRRTAFAPHRRHDAPPKILSPGDPPSTAYAHREPSYVPLAVDTKPNPRASAREDTLCSRRRVNGDGLAAARCPVIASSDRDTDDRRRALAVADDESIDDRADSIVGVASGSIGKPGGAGPVVARGRRADRAAACRIGPRACPGPRIVFHRFLVEPQEPARGLQRQPLTRSGRFPFKRHSG